VSANAQVFISYATPDRAAAESVRTALENAGVSCWIATRDIEPGTDFPATIVEALNAARVLVLILTDHAVASPNVVREIEYAFNARKSLVPFRLSQVALSDELAYYLSPTQWLDAADGCTAENLQRLVDATSGCLAGRTLPIHKGPPRRHVGLIAGLVAGVIAVLLAVAGVSWWNRPKPPAATSTVIPAPVPATTPNLALSIQRTWLNPQDGQEYIRIPPGTFTMGCSPADDQCSDDEKPAHPVRIDRGFWLGRTEVTVAAYRAYAAKHGLKAPAGADNLPITRRTWAEAKKFCEDVGGRLPTEAEWEYAARAGSTQAYSGVLAEAAWYGDEARATPHPVKTKAQNAFGLWDMLGNVSEWVLDRYYNRYDLEAPATGPNVEEPRASNASAVIRGGFWSSNAASLRFSHRVEMDPGAADPIIGFRCANDHP